MLRAIAGRLTYANVVSTLCLFIVLGGGAYAATQIDGSQLKKRSVPGDRVKKDALGGKEIKEKRLARVPDAARLGGKLPGAFLGAGQKAKDADRLDGADSSTFVRGARARVISGAAEDLGSKDLHDILDVPGVGGLDLNCGNRPNDAQLIFTYTAQRSDDTGLVSYDVGAADPIEQVVNRYDQVETTPYKPAGGSDMYTFHIYSPVTGFPPRHVTLITATMRINDFRCQAWATAVDQIVEE